ncbi:hypothetical protein CDAR_222851, partial [Caerostris darwini]
MVTSGKLPKCELNTTRSNWEVQANPSCWLKAFCQDRSIIEAGLQHPCRKHYLEYSA